MNKINNIIYILVKIAIYCFATKYGVIYEVTQLFDILEELFLIFLR